MEEAVVEVALRAAAHVAVTLDWSHRYDPYSDGELGGFASLTILARHDAACPRSLRQASS
ncbi:hypothetical protein DD238_006265 [Peronospora effusa]|uniref:Uncharacterized protein n=1 Tax=Peronospora effusa TaxID=542832 RepID=A0A3M6VQ70_9STRA|nr:hypothetical protein DD238_006265 [Peronospora effusa]RQM11356.1 hypothetical protein DD237_006684 [Peronospora effusa]